MMQNFVSILPLPSNRRRRFLAAVGGVALAVATAGGGSTALSADREHTIIVARSGQISTLDPLRADYNQTNTVASALYDTLVTYDGTKLVGSLAVDFAYAPDGKSISFALRQGVKFHDGATLTAKDVAYTLDRLKRLGVGVASLIDDYASTSVSDDTHFTINLSKPNLLVLPALSKVYVLNSALVGSNAGADDAQAWLQSHDAGSGPFLLGDQSQAVTIDLFKDYWAMEPGRPETIVFRRIDESSTLRDELRAGTIDVAYNFAAREAAAVASDPNLKVVPFDTTFQTVIAFNTQQGPTADPKVRKALRMVYDYSGGLRGIRAGYGKLANGPLPGRLDCRPDLPEVKRDLDAARALLAEAGATDLKVKMNFQPAFDMQKQEATLFQSNLREIGVDLELEPIAFPTYLASLKNPKSIPQMMLFEDTAAVPDAGIILVKGYRSDAVGTNRTAYSNPEVDRLLDMAIATPEDGKRCDLYKQVQTILDSDSVMIDMYGVYLLGAYRTQALADLKPSLMTSGFEPRSFRLAKP